MAEKRKSKLSGKLGGAARKAFDQHKEDAIDYGKQRLPGNVQGIARLSKCYFDEYKTGVGLKGNLYFRAEGVVVESDPPGHEGKVTSIMEPLCDTVNAKKETTPQSEHLVKAQNEMRKLDPNAMEGIGEENIDDLEEVAESLAESGIHFKFSTTQSAPNDRFPNPKVFENWFGSKGLEDYVSGDNETLDVDKTGDPAPEPPKAAPPAAKPAAVAATATKPVTKPVVAPAKAPAAPPAAQEPSGVDNDSLDILAAVANDDNDEHQIQAQTELTTNAEQAGVGEEDLAKANDWTEVVVLIRAAQEATAAPPEAPTSSPAVQAAPFIPVVGTTYKYKAKGKPKAIEVECQNVSKLKKTADVIDNATNKVFAGIAWADLKL